MSNDKTRPDTLANGILGSAISLPSSAQSPGLASFWARPVVNGLYYNGKEIQLDGYKFVGCRFDKCLLKVNSDNFELINCVIDQSTQIQYSRNVAKVLKLFLGRFSWSWTWFPLFVPAKNPDGSETIADQG